MNVYAQTARFDTGRALTDDELRTLAPSVFGTTAHESRSDRFAPIPTIEVVRSLAKEGFSVVGAKQAIVRLDGKRDFAKHLLRLRRLDDAKKYQVGDTVFEMLLKNANDGTAAYDLIAGLFKIACLNSLVAATAMLEALRVKHTGDVNTKVIEGTYRVLECAETALAAPQDWSKTMLDDRERAAFADSAHALRFADNEGIVTTPITSQQLLVPRRSEDANHSLWSTFNTVQEHVIKGGDHAYGRDANNRRIRRTSRTIKGIDQDVRLNKQIWLLAAKMQELKAPAIAA